MANGSGVLGLPPTNQFMWLRANESIFTNLSVPDPSAGPTSAHFEMIISVRAQHQSWLEKGVYQLTAQIDRTTSRRRVSRPPRKATSSRS